MKRLLRRCLFPAETAYIHACSERDNLDLFIIALQILLDCAMPFFEYDLLLPISIARCDLIECSASCTAKSVQCLDRQRIILDPTIRDTLFQCVHDQCGYVWLGEAASGRLPLPRFRLHWMRSAIASKEEFAIFLHGGANQSYTVLGCLGYRLAEEHRIAHHIIYRQEQVMSAEVCQT